MSARRRFKDEQIWHMHNGVPDAEIAHDSESDRELTDDEFSPGVANFDWSKASLLFVLLYSRNQL